MKNKILVLIFAIVIFFSTLFSISNLAFAAGPYIALSNITSTTVDVTFNTAMQVSSQYEIYVRTNATDKYQYKKINNSELDKDGKINLYFSDLVPNSPYRITVEKDKKTILSENFQTLTLDKKARIFSFSPESGKVDDLITIIGENFDTFDGILFNEVESMYDTITPTKITVKVPPGNVTGKITVKTIEHGDAVSEKAFKYIYTVAPGELITLNANNISTTSATLYTTGQLEKKLYTIYVYNQSDYSPSGDKSKFIFKKEFNLQSEYVDTIVARFDDLTPDSQYVGLIDFNMGANYVSPVTVKFKTLSQNQTSNNTSSGTATPSFTDKTTGKYLGIVPRCNVGEIDTNTGQYKTPCNFNYFMELINNVIKFLLFVIATPLVALIIIYVAYLYLTAGGSAEKTSKAKHIFFNVIIGYVIALAAWLIINAIMTAFLPANSDVVNFLK